jgi:hypothetical protein
MLIPRASATVSRACNARQARPVRLRSKLMQTSRVAAAKPSNTKYQIRPPLSFQPAIAGGSITMPVENPRFVSYSPPR